VVAVVDDHSTQLHVSLALGMSARAIEDRFLSTSVRTVAHGGALAQGNVVKSYFGDPLKERTLSLDRDSLQV